MPFSRRERHARRQGIRSDWDFGNTGDSIGNATVWFAAYGAELVNAKGDIVIELDKVREFLEWNRGWSKFCRATR